VKPSASRFVVKNTVLMTVGLFAGRILAFLVFRRLTGAAGTAGTGVWGTAVDLTTIILTVSNFGLGALITREAVKRRDRTASLFWAALRIRGLLGLVTYGLLVVYVTLTGFDPPTRAAILVMALGVFLESSAMAADSILQAHEKVQFQTASQLVSAVVYFGLAWWWLDAGYGLMGVVWANVASRLARLLVIVPLMVRHCGPWRRVPGDGVSMWWLARLGLPVFASTTFGIVSYRVDTVMIMEMLGKVGAGIYTIGHRLLDLMLILPNIVGLAMFPSLQRYREHATQADVERMGERALRYLHLTMFPLALASALAAAPLIHVIAESGHLGPSIRVFRIVVWGLPIQAASHVYNRLLIAVGRERSFVKISLAAMVTNVSLNLALIPRFRWYGAAAATICSLLLSQVLYRREVTRSGLRVPWRRAQVGGSAAALIAWLAAAGAVRLVLPGWGTGWGHWPDANWWIIIAMGLVYLPFYAAALRLLGVVDAEDLRVLRETFRR